MRDLSPGRRWWRLAAVTLGRERLPALGVRTVSRAIVTRSGASTRRRLHRAWWVVAGAFCAIVAAGAFTTTAGLLVDPVGMRRVVTGPLAVLALGAGLTTTMTQAWQFTLFWGLLIGVGTGSVGLTFAATVTGRWFAAVGGW